MNAPRACVLAVAMSCATLAARVSPQQPTPPVFRAQIDVVSVNVSVKDGRHPVAGLTAADFEVLDNGVRQEVDAVSLEKIAIDVTLVLTGYRDNSSAEHLSGLVNASEVQALLAPTDRLRIVAIGDGVKGHLVGPGYAVPTTHQDTRQIPGISLIDGLFYALAWPVEADRRHLVVAFTDGGDTWSTLEAERLPTMAAHSDAVFHAVFWKTPNDVERVPSGSGAGSIAGSIGAVPVQPSVGKPKMGEAFVREWERGYRAVIAAVDRTGGTYRPASTGGDAFKSVLEDFRTSYVLRFTPRGVDRRGWHELTLRVTRPGSFTLRARKGYEAN